MKPAWQVMKGTPSIRTLFLFVSANSPFLHLPGRLSSNFGVFPLNGHLYQTVFSLKLTPRQCRTQTLRWGGGGGPPPIQPLHKGGAVPPKFFWGLKIRAPPLDLPLQELFPVIHLLFSLTLSMLDISIRHTMVAVLVPCILDSGLNV